MTDSLVPAIANAASGNGGERPYRVYCLTCKATGQKYIGITSKTLAKRYWQHCFAAKRGSTRYLSNAIRKYGTEGFALSLLYEAVNEREAYAVEKGLIAAYGTLAPNGFNLNSGGVGGNTLAPAARKRLSEAVQSHWDSNPSRRGQISAQMRAYYATPEGRRGAIERAALRKRKTPLPKTAGFQTAEHRRLIAEGVGRTWVDGEVRQRRIDALLEYWKKVRSGEIPRNTGRNAAGQFAR